MQSLGINWGYFIIQIGVLIILLALLIIALRAIIKTINKD